MSDLPVRAIAGLLLGGSPSTEDYIMLVELARRLAVANVQISSSGVITGLSNNVIGSIVAGPITYNDALVANSSLTVNGASVANGTLLVQGALTTNSTGRVNGTMLIQGVCTVNNNLIANGTLLVQGELDCNAALNVNSSITSTSVVAGGKLKANTSGIYANGGASLGMSANVAFLANGTANTITFRVTDGLIQSITVS